jgi:hypothetical protein
MAVACPFFTESFRAELVPMPPDGKCSCRMNATRGVEEIPIKEWVSRVHLPDLPG